MTIIPVRHEWKPGTITKVSPEKAAEQFSQIAARDGSVVPAVVVDENRPNDAPLHEHFEWHDPIAAEKYREDQARYLLRHLVTVHVNTQTEDELQPTRAFVRVTQSEGIEQKAGYEPVKLVLSDKGNREAYIKQAMQELIVWRSRYAHIAELADLFAQIDALGL